jgi:hypothetical protein
MHVFLTPGPQWFSGSDFIVDLFSMFILLLIGFFAWKFYSINKNRKHLMMFISLSILAASFVFKIITYLLLYLTTFKIQILSVLGQLVYYMEPNNFYFSVAFIIYSVLTLIGFYILYTVYEPDFSARTNLLMIYLLLVIALFSENAYLFMHLTAMILSVFITFSLWNNYKKNKLSSTKYLAFGFGTISLSRIFFILANTYSSMYVIGEIIQFLGYFLLLLTFVAVLKHGKKTGKNKDN